MGDATGKGKAAIKCAIRTGYRHIDTAHMYKNEDIVGQAIAESIAVQLTIIF